MSRRRLSSFEPVDLDDAFDLAVKITHGPVLPPAPIPTGLSDEEDAQRHLALRFNPSMRFCPNCETVVDWTEEYGPWCRFCGDHLRDVGSPPRKRKQSVR